MQFIYQWLMMSVIGKYLKMNYHICLIIYWIWHVMKKYWGCIKRCVEDIYMYIRVVLSFILKHIERCEKR